MSLSRVKSLGKDSLIYGLTGIISRMITVFLVPVYTRIFHPSDYGIISLINTTFFLASILSICALDNAAARWFYDDHDVVNKKKTFSSWFWFQFGLSILFIIVLSSLTPIFARHVIQIPVSELWLIWLLPCATLLTNILPNIMWNWYRLHRRPKATLIYTLSQSLLTIGLTILFVVKLDWHIIGVYAALLISSFIFSIIALYQIHTWLAIKFFNKARISEMLRYSVPMIPAAIAFWLLNSTDAYFIQYFKGQSEVGLFSVGASVASAVSLFTGAFQQAWGPFAYSILKEPDAKKTYANVFLAFGILSSILLLGMFLFSPEILTVFTTSEYYDAAWVASILSLNIILIAFSDIASLGASIMKNTTYYAKGILMAALLTVALNLLLIPILGKEGSAIATVLAQLIVPIYLFYKSYKLYPIEFNFRQVGAFLLLAIATGVIFRVIKFSTPWMTILVKITIFFMFVFFVLYFLRSITRVILSKFKLYRVRF